MLTFNQFLSFSLASAVLFQLTLEESNYEVLTNSSYEDDVIVRQNYDASQDDLLEMMIRNYAKYNQNLNIDEFQETQPVIGIPTMKVFEGMDMYTDTFQWPHFTWETNVNFVHYAGSWAVPIKYDLDDEDLYAMLDAINGVFFTGGATELFDRETGAPLVHTPYWKTAKKIFDYSKMKKDVHGVNFPLFGVCQGFELLNALANEGHEDSLTEVVIYKESRPVHWKYDVRQESTLFSEFPQHHIDDMGEEKLALHAHTFVVATETYENRSQLSDFYNILATDTHKVGDEDVEFVVAIEAKNYPISGVMFHPETQQMKMTGEGRENLTGKVNNQQTDEINFYFSQALKHAAMDNLKDGHKFASKEQGLAMEWLNTYVGYTNYGDDAKVVSYGLN